MCKEEWALPTLRTIYGSGVLCLQFLAPFMFIGFCYARIWWFLAHRNNMVANRPLRQCDIQRKRRMNKVCRKRWWLSRESCHSLQMLIMMVVIFGVCWLPMNVLNILRDAGLTQHLPFVRRNFSSVFLTAHLIAISGAL